MRRTPSFRAGFAAVSVALSLLGGVPSVCGGVVQKFLQRDVDVISVTDVTEAGRAHAPASPERPVRYKLIYVGDTAFGRSWQGESLPAKKDAIRWMIAAMQSQGYLLADASHPPEQLFVFGWGMMSGDKSRRALGFLGGDKVNLMWENETQYGGFVNPNVLRRGMIRAGIAGKIWDFAESDLFMGVVRSYTMDSETAPTPTKLWETRFACPATGLAFSASMPLLIKAAAVHFGRETVRPVSSNATDRFGGTVNFGEFKILGEEQTGPKPGRDGSPANGEK